MDEVRKWVKEEPVVQALKSVKGVKKMEMSFCAGNGWLGVLYLFEDLSDLENFGEVRLCFSYYPTTVAVMQTPEFKVAKAAVLEHPHYDKSRSPQEFRGFFFDDA